MPPSFLDDLRRYGPDASYDLTPGQARDYCAALTASHYENFSVVTWLTPRHLRPAFESIYAFCRWSDDLGDEVGDRDRSRALLGWWRGLLLDLYRGHARHPVMMALAPTVAEFSIPIDPFLALISAFEQDQDVTDYDTYEQLLDYCTRSANPVGHLVLYLARAYDDANARLSNLTCTGLQLANFWQDVARDQAIGRVYLPREDRERFGYPDDDLRPLRFTPAFAELLRFEVERTRALLVEGRALVPRMPRELAVPVDLFSRGGLAVLDRIAAQGYDVLTSRPKLGKPAKFGLLARAFLSSWRSGPVPGPPGHAAGHELRTSYDYCSAVARREAKNFYPSFLLLPADRRRSMCALYAFMRRADDIADGPGDPGSKRAALSGWRADLQRLTGDWPGWPALADTVARHGVPTRYLAEVIDGVAMDVEPGTFATFPDLYAYCYRVASAVGLCCLHIWGFRSENGRAESLAESCGLALQLTNIIRDVREDASNGRVYLPQDDLDWFGVTTEDLANDTPQRRLRVRQLLAFQADRAADFYNQAEPLPGLVDRASRPMLLALVGTYRELLREIRRRDYDVMSGRVSVSPWRKAAIVARSYASRFARTEPVGVEAPHVR